MEWDIAYNTTKDPLVIKEYGRGVQDLLRRANAVEDDAERQAYVERVLEIMVEAAPDVKNQDNYRERLWKHAFQIAGEPLKVSVPEGIDVSPDAERERPERLPYPEGAKTRMRHYGENVQSLIRAAKELDDGPEKDLATYTAAYYMKVALDAWDQGKFVNEEMIRRDLYEMSDKQLVLAPNVKIGSPGPNQPKQDLKLRKKKKKKGRSKPQIQAKPGGSNSSRRKNRRKNRRR